MELGAGFAFREAWQSVPDSSVDWSKLRGELVRICQRMSEIASEAHAKRIREHIRSGIRSGVNGTPTFFINGVRYDGSWEAPHLLATLEAAA